LLLVVLILSLVFSACTDTPDETPDQANTLSLLQAGAWTDDTARSTNPDNYYRGRSSYSLSEGDNPFSTIRPHKYHKDNSLSFDLSAEDLSSYRKLVITAKGDGLMKVIFTTDLIVSNQGHMLSYPLSILEDTFEFNLDFEGYDVFREAITRITVIFGADVNENDTDLRMTPPVHAFTSEINISRFEFSDAEPNLSRTFNARGIVYDPDGDDNLPDVVSFLDDFTENDTGSYVLSEDEDGHVITTTSNKAPWSFVFITLEGNYKAYTEIRIEVNGTAGARFKMKLEGASIDAYETGSTTDGNIEDPLLDGTWQTFVWHVPSDHMTFGEPVMFIIFFEPGDQGTGVTMTVRSLELAK
jgi:hypothetical protein